MTSNTSRTRKFDEEREALSRAQEYFVKIKAKNQKALSSDPQDSENVTNAFPDPPKRQSRCVKLASSVGEKLTPLSPPATTPSKRKSHPETHRSSTETKKASKKAVDRPSGYNLDDDVTNTTPPKSSIPTSTTKMLTRSQRKGAGIPMMDSVLSTISKTTTSPTKNDGKKKSNTPSKRKVPPLPASISDEAIIVSLDQTSPKRGRHSMQPKIDISSENGERSDKKKVSHSATNKLLPTLPRAPTVPAPMPTDSETLLRSLLCDAEATTERPVSARMPSTKKRLPRPPSSKLLPVSHNNTSSDGIAMSLSMIQQPKMNVPSSSSEQKPVTIFPASDMEISAMEIDFANTADKVPSLLDEDNVSRQRTESDKRFGPIPTKSNDDNVNVNGLEVIKNSFMVDVQTTDDGKHLKTTAINVDVSPSFRLMQFIGIFFTLLIAMYLSTPVMDTTLSIQPIMPPTVQSETDIVKAFSETMERQQLVITPMVSSWSVESVQEQLEP